MEYSPEGDEVYARASVPQNPADASPSFKYHRLDSTENEIRLLRLGRIDPPDLEGCRVEGTMIYASVNDPNIKYHALSYMWGTSETHQKIFLDGCYFPITENLEDALWSLQDNPTSELEPFVL